MPKYEHFTAIITFLHNHPHWGGVFAFLAAFTETLAVIGSFVPGSITMTIVGALAGSAVIPLYTAFICATAGAFSGDLLSYWIGYRYKHWVLTRWPLKNHPQWITRCEDFFARHGGKSVIIGRFIAPMRSLVPMVAGILNMRPMPFIPIVFVSALLWTIVYLIPGILLGALSVETPPSITTEFILITIGIVVGLWLISWLMSISFRITRNTLNRGLTHWWSKQSHKRTYLWQIFAPMSDPNDYSPLVLCLLAFMTSCIFIVISYQVSTHTGIYHINAPVQSLARSIHFDWLSALMIGISMIGGDKHVWIIVELAVTIWLISSRQWWALFCWVLLIALVIISVTGFKTLIAMPRPEGLMVQKTSFSYPSGHTTLALTVPCFLMVLIASQLKQYRWIPYALAVTIALLVPLSRVYLTVHWFADIIGGIFLGLTLLFLITALYYRGPYTRLHVKPFMLTIGSIWLFVFILYGWVPIPWIHHSARFSRFQYEYQLAWPSGSFTFRRWWDSQASEALPTYRNNRLGYPVEPFNFYWLGELDQLKSTLLKHQWKPLPKGEDWRSLLKRYALHRQNQRLPILPQLYQNHRPVLLMLRSNNNDAPKLILRLWPSGYQIRDRTHPLWIGTVQFYEPPYHYWLQMENKKSEGSSIDQLQADLKSFATKRFTYTGSPPKHIPWDGVQLFATQKAGDRGQKTEDQ